MKNDLQKDEDNKTSQMNNESSKNNSIYKLKESKKSQSWIWVVSILLGIYILVSIFFSFMTYPNAKINGESLGVRKISDVKNIFDEQTTSIIGRDNKTVTLNNSQAGLKQVALENQTYVQHGFLWPVEFIKGIKTDVKVKKSVDSNKLKETLKNSELFKNIKEPKNAQLIFENKKAIIKPEELGNKLDLDKVCESVIKGFNEHKDEIKLSSEYINPQVTKKSLEPNKKELENIAKASITLKLPNGESQKIEDNSIFLDENYKFEDKKVRIFVDDLKEKFEVVGKDFDFTTHNGKSIKVKAKVFGNEINKKQTVAMITDALKNGKTIDSDLVYSRRSRNNGVLGKSYIEISLGAQHLWYFKDGKLVLDTPVVTGDPSIDHETPTGLFEIWSKETDRFLRGFNPDGSKYKVHVDYWMQIDYTGVGIHDTKGRAAYGGQIFNGAGSHGCINTPINQVRTIFNSAENAMPVVIY